jgi:hypothetical protein
MPTPITNVFWLIAWLLPVVVLNALWRVARRRGV